MFAVIETGGKQYLVKAGDTLNVEKIPGTPNTSLEFNNVLLVGSVDGSARIGNPYLSGAKVLATVLEQGKGPKLFIVKYHSKTRYRRRTGHRQLFTKVKIQEIK